MDLRLIPKHIVVGAITYYFDNGTNRHATTITTKRVAADVRYHRLPSGILLDPLSTSEAAPIIPGPMTFEHVIVEEANPGVAETQVATLLTDYLGKYGTMTAEQPDNAISFTATGRISQVEDISHFPLDATPQVKLRITFMPLESF